MTGAAPEVDDPVTDDVLTARFRIFQRKHGHRYSLDDVVVAWEAAQARPTAERVLDLGCGIGSVLLMVADRLSHARFTGIEAQDVSFALATKNVARNDLASRARLVHGDFRDDHALDRFDLVTGTPPYQPPGTATPSPDAQRTYARIEMRGGVEAYLAAGARRLAEGGVLVVCGDARRPERVLDVAPSLGLRPVRRRDVVPRAGRNALFTVWTLVHDAPEPTAYEEAELVVRDVAGVKTSAARALRAFFGLVNEGE